VADDGWDAAVAGSVADILRKRLGPLAEHAPAEEAPGDEPPNLIIHNDRAKALGWQPRDAETMIVETAEACSISSPGTGRIPLERRPSRGIPHE
jgi:hypothetical protein